MDAVILLVTHLYMFVRFVVVASHDKIMAGSVVILQKKLMPRKKLEKEIEGQDHRTMMKFSQSRSST